ncbi:MAG: mechanosensitive ion channel [Planctomycetaceae bacterium]|nr:mechanosensitive ion channel [Planctomycetaceae bacterium]
MLYDLFRQSSTVFSFLQFSGSPLSAAEGKFARQLNSAPSPEQLQASAAGANGAVEPALTPGAAEGDGIGELTDSVWGTVGPWLSADAVTDKLRHYGPRILAAIAVLVIGRLIARVISNMVVRGATRARLDETLARFAGNLCYIILLTAVFITSLGCLGVNTTSLSAILAAAGFAIGMALQGSLGNFASGFLLVFFKPFRVGDVIEVAGTKGTVVEIQLFSTILLTGDNVRIIIPNSSVTGGTIQNFSIEKRRRIDLIIGCGYNDDIRAVKAFLQDVVVADERVLSDPAPLVAVSELGESSVNFVVRPWVKSKDYWPVRFALTEKIKLGFDEHGYTIPFPSRDVFVHANAFPEVLPKKNLPTNDRRAA